MLDNQKFIGLLLMQEDLDFSEEFKTLPQEDQDVFVDFVLEIMTVGIKLIKDLPQDQKIQSLIEGISMFPPEIRSDLATIISNSQETD